MKLNDILTLFTDTLLTRDTNQWHNPAVRWLVKQYKLLFYTARGVLEHDTLIRSAALTFYTLMSLVPIVAVLFAFVKGFGLGDRLVESLYGIFPQSPEIVEYLIQFAEKALLRTQGGLVATVALLMLFWTIIRVFSSIESAFNNIWEVKVERSITRQYTDYIAVLLIIPLLWITASALSHQLQETFLVEQYWYLRIVSRIVSLITVWIMFTLLYMVIPNTKVQLNSALMAGIVAGTLFFGFQWGYVHLQKWMTSYNAIYGSFVALPLLLIWLQTSWQILLFGGELSFAYQNVSRFDEERESLLVTYDQRRKIMLAAMIAIVRNFRDKGGPLSSEAIREHLSLPTRIVNDVLFQLVQSGQLIAVRTGEGDRQVSYAPGYAISEMTICGILDAVEGHGKSNFQLTPTDDMTRINQELEQLKLESRQSPSNEKLIDMLS